MSFDGSGTFTVLYNWATEAASPPIAISKLDSEFAGIATGLSSCMLRTGGTVSGASTFSAAVTFSSAVTFSGTTAYSLYYETDAAANEKYWNFAASGGNFYIQALDDAASNAVNLLLVTRTGTTVDAMTLTATQINFTCTATAINGACGITGAATLSSTLAVAGNVAVATNKFTVAAASGNTLIAGTLTVGAIDFTPSSGTFTAYLRASNGSADLASGTATWKKSNGVVTLFLPALTYSGTSTTLVVDGLPAAIQTSANTFFTSPGYVDGSQSALRPTLASGTDYIELYGSAGQAIGGAGSNTRGILATNLTYLV